VLLSNNQ